MLCQSRAGVPILAYLSGGYNTTVGRLYGADYEEKVPFVQSWKIRTMQPAMYVPEIF